MINLAPLLQIEQKRSTAGLDVRRVLMEMRTYRMGLIQTPDQLRFSYLAIIEGARRVLARSPDSGFEVSAHMCRVQSGQRDFASGPVCLSSCRSGASSGGDNPKMRGTLSNDGCRKRVRVEGTRAKCKQATFRSQRRHVVQSCESTF